MSKLHASLMASRASFGGQEPMIYETTRAPQLLLSNAITASWNAPGALPCRGVMQPTQLHGISASYTVQQILGSKAAGLGPFCVGSAAGASAFLHAGRVRHRVSCNKEWKKSSLASEACTIREPPSPRQPSALSSAFLGFAGRNRRSATAVKVYRLTQDSKAKRPKKVGSQTRV